MTTLLTLARKKQLISFSLVFVMVLVLFFVSTFTAHAAWYDGALNLIKEIVHIVLTSIPGVLVWLSGLMLNYSINTFIVGMGDLFRGGVGFAVNNLWQIIRDTLNILFIFSLIYIGIKTILNSEDSGTRKALIHLIGAALLINFSLFIAKAIVDFSNVIAVQIFNLFIHSGPSGIGEADRYGISGAFMDVMGILDLSSSWTILEDYDLVVAFTYSFMVMIFLLIATVVFAAGAFMIMARFIALVIFLIFSPVMFLGWILPSFKQYSSDWWKKFFSYTFFAPAYLFMLYLSLITLQRFQGGGAQGGSLGDMLDGGYGESFFHTVLTFMFTAGMLIASIIVAQKMSIAGAGTSMNVMQSLRKGVQNNAKSFAGRQSIGRIGNWMAKKTEKNEGSEKGRKRNARITALTGGLFDAQSRIKAGKSMRSNTFGGSRSFESQEAWSKERAEMQSKGETSSKLTNALTAWSGDKTNPDNIIAMEEALSQASAPELAVLAKDDKYNKLLAEAAGSMDQNKFDKILEDKELKPEHKTTLHEGRLKSVRSNIKKKGAGNLSNGLKSATDDELNSLDFKNDILPNALYIQSSQMEKLEKKWGPEKFRLLEDKQEEQMLTLFDSGDAGAAQLLDTRKGEKEVAKLPSKIFKDTARLQRFVDVTVAGVGDVKMTGGLLQNIASEGKLSGTDKKNLGSVVIRAYAGRTLPKDIVGFFKSPAGSAFN